MMQRVILSTARTTSSRSTNMALRGVRAMSSSTSASKTAPNIGTIKRRSKTPSMPGRAAPGTPEAEQEIMAAAVSQEVSGEVFRNNILLAAACVTFCTGVMYYSMHAVGQSGATEDDPLAALKQEAAEAAAVREKESRQSEQATAMLQQFSKGAFDPDQIEDDDEEDVKPKKPWWKFW